MTSFPILDLVIGLIFLYFLLSIICSSGVEMILTMSRVRAKLLEKWLLTIFDKTITQPDGTTLPLGQAIMDHCSNTVLSKPGSSPSYIHAKNFTSTLLEKITYNPANPNSVAIDINNIITSLEGSDMLSTEFKRVLLTYAHEAKESYEAVSEKTLSEIDIFKTKVEHWYDGSMSRLAGSMKRRYITYFTLIIAALMVGGLNADTIEISKFLYKNPDVAKQLANSGIQATKDSTYALVDNLKTLSNAHTDSISAKQLNDLLDTGAENINTAMSQAEQFIPLGWNSWPIGCKGWIVKIVGLVATILATTLGAPFWFDLLNKIASLRGSGNPPNAVGSGNPNKKK